MDYGYIHKSVIRPLGIDLFCGLGGWTEGLLAEGYEVIGFDLERHVYGKERYPAQLVLQDVLTLHGRQFKDSALIVASPPCQAYSYRAMPWKRAKALPPPPPNNSLFEACFRIQGEAIAAAGHHIPLVVENVRGAQKWVGRSRWNFGSFHLWGDVPALMPIPLNAIKNNGGSWFKYAHNTGSGCGQNPDGRKVPSQNWSRYGKTGEVSAHWRMEGIKIGGDWFSDPKWGGLGGQTKARKHASAMIAKIPLPLAQYIASVYKPLCD